MGPRLSAGFVAFLVATSAVRLIGQGPAGQTALAFEVASIKPNSSGAPGPGGLGWGPNGIRASNMAPATLLSFALGVQADQIADTPSWASNDRFDINARVRPGQTFDPMTMVGPMLLNLLEERFRLKTHHETRELSVYRLVRVRADRLGPKITPAPADACAPPAQTDVASLREAARRCSGGPGPGGISVHGMPITTLAKFMGPSAGRVIVDASGLNGNWDLDLTFVNPLQNSSDSDGPSLFTALEEQLGLKLESGRAPVDVIVIDRLERPTPD